MSPILKPTSPGQQADQSFAPDNQYGSMGAQPSAYDQGGLHINKKDQQTLGKVVDLLQQIQDSV